MTKPAQSRASLSMGTNLSVGRVSELAAKAAPSVDDPNGRVRVEERTQNLVVLSVRDHIEGGELMRFSVTVDRASGRTSSRTMITSFTTKSGVSALMPPAKRKLVAFSAYEAFLDWFVSGVVAEDPQAIVTLVSGE